MFLIFKQAIDIADKDHPIALTKPTYSDYINFQYPVDGGVTTPQSLPDFWIGDTSKHSYVFIAKLTMVDPYRNFGVLRFHSWINVGLDGKVLSLSEDPILHCHIGATGGGIWRAVYKSSKFIRRGIDHKLRDFIASVQG